MKPFLYIFIILLVFPGCNSKTNRVRKPVTNIQITPSNRPISYGNEFIISIQSKIIDPQIENIDVFIGNKLINSSSEESFTLKVESKDFLPGIHRIRTVAKNKAGKSGTHYRDVLIVSDIEPKNLTYKIIDSYPHNEKNFTQGFEFHNNLLYEGTGNYGETYIYAYNLEDQKIIKSKKIDKQYFGEGITILNDRLFQLTYRSGKGFVYDLDSFEKINEFNLPSKEGWGLTNNGEFLIMSDGTEKITFLNPVDFSVVKKISVTTPKGILININELEYVDGFIYANIWTSTTIAKIEAETGRVVAMINLYDLLNDLDFKQIDVLNGIAYHEDQDAFYLTGKYWPRMFKVLFIENP